MIDEVYKTVQSIINKDNYGYISPVEFNLMVNQVQYEIFQDYFSDENRDKTRQNRGNVNTNYSDLPFMQRQKITRFAATTDIFYSSSVYGYPLPSDLYYIEKNGVIDPKTNRVIAEIERGNISYASKSLAKPSSVFPFYENYKDFIRVLGHSPTTLTIRYLRKPKQAKWTYNIVNNQPLFNPSAPDYSDIDLHPSEFANIVVRLCALFGVNIREGDVLQYAESIKQQNFQKENS